MFFERPELFAAIRAHAMPRLRTYPSIRVWNVGCGDGADAYALAVVLKESGLLDRAYVYATDTQLPQAGVLPPGSLDAQAYVDSGGVASLAEYAVREEAHVRIRPALAQRVFFGQHDAALEASFNEFQLIYCPRLPDDPVALVRTIAVIEDSVCRFGMLSIALELPDFEPIGAGLYRRVR